MPRSSPRTLAAVVLTLLATAGCRAPVPAPMDAPAATIARDSSVGVPSSTTPATTTDTVRRGYTVADVRFVTDMVAHHAQALVMTALVPSRTTREDLRRLAQRIEVSQQDEIATMQRWLKARGEAVPDAQHAHHGAAAHGMPGMATPAQLDSLAGAGGPDFERRFLELMIRHHQGALVMVRQLFGTPGAGQEPELFGFASDVDADQRAEIARMQRLLGALSK